MDLKDLFKDVTSFNKTAAMKENLRMEELKNKVTSQAFMDAQNKLSSYFGDIQLDSAESNLTEFSRNKLSGKMKALLTVSTTAGVKKLPIHFVVKASVASMVETPEQVVSALENVEGSIDKEVNEILEKQKQLSTYHNDDIEVKADNNFDGKYDSDDVINAVYKVLEDNVNANYDWDWLLTYKGSTVRSVSYYDYSLRTTESLSSFYNDNAEFFDKYFVDLDTLDNFISKVKNELETNYLDSATKENDELKDYYTETSINSNITVQAKKKEIDLGVRENLFSEQFPVKLLVYPKTYLPELKKGDILNVGGFKYRYIGDEPTISGDTENGINARFELVCNNKKASLDVTAKNDKVTDKAKEEVKEVIKEQTNNDFSDLEPNEIIEFLTNYKAYNIVPPSELLKQVSGNPQLSAWYMENYADSLTGALEEATPNMVKAVLSSPKYTLEVVEHFVDEKNTFDSIPQQFRGVLLSDAGILEKMIRDNKNLFSEEVAKQLLDNNQSAMEALVMTEEEKFGDTPGFKYLKDWADKNGVFDSANEPEQNIEPTEDVITEEQGNVVEEKEDEVEKTSSVDAEQPIEKESAVDDLSFEVKLNDLDSDSYLEDVIDIVEKIKEKKPELKSIPKEWFHISDIEVSGYVKWRVLLDARDWGISQLSVIGDVANFDVMVDFDYYKDAQAADQDESEFDYVSFEFSINNVECELSDSVDMSSGFQLTPRSYEILDPESMVLKF